MTIKLREEDFAAAWNILQGTIEDTDALELFSHSQSPEEMLIKAQEFERLSPEAKEVVDIIVNGPSEVFSHFTTSVRNILSRKNVRIFFERYFNSKFIASNVIKELTKWVNHL